MGQESEIAKIQFRILFALLFSITASFFVGLNYSPIQGYYVFAISFILISVFLTLSNFEMVRSKLEISSPKFLHLLVLLVSIFILSTLLNNNLGFPLLPSIGLSIVCFMFVNWVYYSLEPLRG